MTPGLIDTHCHLDLAPLYSQLPRIIFDATAAGVTGFVVPGVHPDGWPAIAALAAENRRIFPAFGIHPMHADSADDQTLALLSELTPQGIAIGEIGLDPAYPAPLDLQERVFRAQIRIAVHHGVPVLIHCRRSFQRLLKIMREEGAHQAGGIMHAFSGSTEIAREFIRLGFAIAISGTVTWHNAVKPLRLAQELPLEHLVLETDAPDMTPLRYRGLFNRPAWIVETAQRVADIRGTSVEEVAKITTANARRVLRFPYF